MSVSRKTVALVTSKKQFPVKFMAHVLKTIEDDMLEHKNWNDIAYLVGNAGEPIVKRILAECVGGITLKTSTKEAKAHTCKAIIGMGGNMSETGRLDELRQLVKEGGGITEAKKMFGPKPIEKDKADILATWSKSIKARLGKEHITLNELMNAVATA